MTVIYESVKRVFIYQRRRLCNKQGESGHKKRSKNIKATVDYVCTISADSYTVPYDIFFVFHGYLALDNDI